MLNDKPPPGLVIKDRRGSKIGWPISYAARRKMRRALRRHKGELSSKKRRMRVRNLAREMFTERRMVQRYVGIINRETPKQRRRRLRP